MGGSTRVLFLVACTIVRQILCIIYFPHQGYCGYAFTVHDRLLLPANPNIGVLHHKGKYFAFSSKKAADNFATDPDE